MFKLGTSQQPRLSTPLPGCRYQVCTWYTFNAWSSLTHGGKSAPKDTKRVPEGPMKGFGHSVNETVTLPRNDAGSSGNNIKAFFIISRSRRTDQYRRCTSHTLKKYYLQDTHSIQKIRFSKNEANVSQNRVLHVFQRFLMRQSDSDVSI